MYQQTAQGLASLGRGGDDTLVHMNRGEVAGLNALNQAINNRPLSINPHTGMPEAMDLTEILLGLGMAAATVATAGAALPALGAVGGTLATMGVGAGLGAAKNAATGKDPGMGAAFGAASGLTAGVTAGLGGAAEGVAEGATQAATTATEETAKKAIEEGAKQGIEKAVATGAEKGAVQGINQELASTGGGQLANQTSQAIPDNFAALQQNANMVGPAPEVTGADISAGIGQKATTDATNAISPTFQSTAPAVEQPQGIMGAVKQGYADFKEGLPDIGKNALKPFENIAAKPFSDVNKAAFSVGTGLFGLEDSMNQQAKMKHQSAAEAKKLVDQYRNAGVDISGLPQQLINLSNQPTSFAAGGTIQDVQGITQIPPSYINQQPMTDFYPQSMIPQAQPLQRTQPIRHEVIGYADGGPIGYGFAEGGDIGGGDEGLLHGPGTGQSDGIMGLIQGEQGQEPVRLAEGEFVIPADVVSALGDGSTKAGAQALYDMLDRVRQMAYGHTQQINPVDPNQVMPV